MFRKDLGGFFLLSALSPATPDGHTPSIWGVPAVRGAGVKRSQNIQFPLVHWTEGSVTSSPLILIAPACWARSRALRSASLSSFKCSPIKSFVLFPPLD